MSEELENAPEARDGLTADPETDAAAKLLFEAAVQNGNKVLIMDAGCGALALHFSEKFSLVIAQNYLFRNHKVSTEVLQNKKNVVSKLMDLPQAGIGVDFAFNSFDTIIFRLGRGTALVNAVLMESFLLLKQGGNFWVAGHNQEGIKSFAKRAESHFGNQHVVKIRSSCRLLKYCKETPEPKMAVQNPNYFSEIELSMDLPGFGKIPYFSKPGIFSYRTTDLGTQVLLKFFPSCRDGSVLDLGCGSGLLGLAAFKNGAKKVLAVDANVIATNCAAYNFATLSFAGKVQCTNLTDGIAEKFDIILSNPPFHHGSETDFSFPGKILDAALECLAPEGTIYLVANRFLNYLQQSEKRSLQVEILTREQGYCFYKISRK